MLRASDALEETFGAAGSSVKLVVLNACYSTAQAEALLAYVGCVVGMGGSIRDEAAKDFAIGFYGALGDRESVAVAYRQGRAAISLGGLPDAELPSLKVRHGVDAEELVLAVRERTDPSELRARRLAIPEVRSHVVIDEGRLTEVTSHILARRWVGVFGLSGSGKSTLAKCAARRCTDTMPTVWLNVGEQDVGFLLETLAVALGESLAGIAGLENQASCLRAATAAGGTLFVFDDVSRESTADVLLQSVSASNAVIVTGLDAGMLAVTRYRLARIESLPLSPDQSRLVAMRLLQNEGATGHPLDREKAAVDAVVRLAAGQPAVIEVLAGELNIIGLDAAPELEVTLGGIASRSISENLRILGARTLGAIDQEASRIVRALHVFSSNRVGIAALEEVAGCNVKAGLRNLQRRLIVDRDGDVLTFHDYVRRLSREACDELHHEELTQAHAVHYMKLAAEYGGYEWNLRAYPSLVPHENELVPLFWRALQRWDDCSDGVAVEFVLRLAFSLSWYLHWRGYSETRFRMCDEILRRSVRLRGLAQPARSNWSNLIGNLHGVAARDSAGGRRYLPDGE